jgi:glycosyltransferase involved in cell wall biosynthesis
VYHFLPANAVGGISNQTLAIAERLEGDGFEQVVVTPQESGPFLDSVSEAGLEVRQWPYRLPRHLHGVDDAIHDLVWGLLFGPSVLALYRHFRRETVDVVHINGLLLLEPAIAAYLTGVDVVWYLVSDDIYPGWLVRLLTPVVERIATEVAVISEDNRSFYRQPKEETTIVPGAIDTSSLRADEPSDAAVAALEERYGTGDADAVVATLGKVHPMKGQEYAIRALRHLDHDVHYLIVGPKKDDEYVAELNRLCAKHGLDGRVTVTGFVEEKTAVLSLTDIYLLPSIGEGTPLSIMEALARRIPAVATDVGGVSELLDDGSAGQLVQKQSPEAIADALRRYLRDPDLASRHAERGCELVSERYAVETVAESYRDLYEACIDG